MSTHPTPHPSAQSARCDRQSTRDQPRPPRLRSPARGIFLRWLLLLPDGTEAAAAARAEVERIDASRVSDEQTAELRALFVEAAST